MKTKKISMIIMACFMMFVFAGCSAIEKAEIVVGETLSAFEGLDIDEAKNILGMDFLNEEDTPGIDRQAMLQALCAKLQHNILSSEQLDENTVTVKTEITNIDMQPVMTEFFADAMQYAFSTALNQPSEEEMNKKIGDMFIEAMSAPELATVTNTIDVKVIKNEEGEWELDADDVFVNAVLGGLLDTIEDLETTFNEE